MQTCLNASVVLPNVYNRFILYYIGNQDSIKHMIFMIKIVEKVITNDLEVAVVKENEEPRFWIFNINFFFILETKYSSK